MSNSKIKKRVLLFLFVCIPIRSLLVWWTSRKESKKDNDRKQWLSIGIITLLIGIGFLLNGFGRELGYVKNKGLFGGPVYWNSLLHGFLYLLFACLWFNNKDNSYVVLLVDVLVGFLYFMNNYYLKIF